MAQWIVCRTCYLKVDSSSPGRCTHVVFLGKHLTLTVPLSTQVYKWEPANSFGDNLVKCWEVTCDGLVSHPGGSRNTPSCFILH